jgi:hypothetical protein
LCDQFDGVEARRRTVLPDDGEKRQGEGVVVILSPEKRQIGHDGPPGDSIYILVACTGTIGEGERLKAEKSGIFLEEKGNLVDT